jgi:predicted TIM-barrel fold metal-dependent hydrolase
MRRPEEPTPLTPFPVTPVSNLEWVPPPPTERQLLAQKLIAEEMTTRAKRHGMTRAQFMRTAMATVVAFSVLNKVNGLDSSGGASAMPILPEPCDDPAAAKALLQKKTFIMDVQQHHADLTIGNPAGFCFLDFGDQEPIGVQPDDPDCPESIGQLHYIREIFINSETDVGVLSGLPGGAPLGPEGMAKTRDLVNKLAGSTRAVSQAVCDPKRPPGFNTSLDQMERHVKEFKAKALKCYTYAGNWRLDDEAVAYPMLAEAHRLGIRLINTHKGLPAIFAPGSAESVRTTDYPKALADWPDLSFVAYHSGYYQTTNQPGNRHPEGKHGIQEFLEVIATLPASSRSRMYAEIGSTFAIVLQQGPDQAAHFIGALLKALGPDNILWGTDSVWWGSPQWLIDGFKCLTIPDAMQAQFGYPALTEETKRKIFGINAARLYGVKVKKARRNIAKGKLKRLERAQGGVGTTRALGIHGPQTRREIFAMLRRGLAFEA